MKKMGIFLLMVIYCGFLSAQTNTDNSVYVSSNGFAIKTPALTLTMPKGALSIGHGTEKVVISDPLNQPSGTVGTMANAVTLHYGYILPSVSNFMDLGSSTQFFRKIYTYNLFYRISPQQFSDVRCKENIRPLKEASQIICQLRPVSFDFKRTDTLADTSELKNKVGFIAQEVQTVLPHLVGYMPDIDIYTLDYTSILPYLVKAFQELQAEKDGLAGYVFELEEQLGELNGEVLGLKQQIEEVQLLLQDILNSSPQDVPAAAPKSGENSSVKNNGKVSEARLFQNEPNPYSLGTLIRYELPKAVGSAFICIYDVNGKKVRNIPLVPGQGMGSVEISEGVLVPGVYTYSLVVSNKRIDSKRMTVSR